MESQSNILDIQSEASFAEMGRGRQSGRFRRTGHCLVRDKFRVKNNWKLGKKRLKNRFERSSISEFQLGPLAGAPTLQPEDHDLTSFFPEFPVVFNAARVPKAVIVNNHHKHTADETPFYFTVSSIDIKTLIIQFLLLHLSYSSERFPPLLLLWWVESVTWTTR